MIFYTEVSTDLLWVMVQKYILIWDKVLKNGPSEIFGRQQLKNLKWFALFKQTISFHF